MNSPTLTASKVSWKTQKYGLLLYEPDAFYVQIYFGNKLLNLISFVFNFLIPQVLGESMAGISQHCKTGDVVAFGESVGVASKALCGLTEAAGQVRSCCSFNSLFQVNVCPLIFCSSFLLTLFCFYMLRMTHCM